jgi:hypothetical protein
LRRALEAWVTKYDYMLKQRVAVAIVKPEGYDPGAWQVSVRLRQPSESTYDEVPIPFALPELPRRRIASDKQYRAVLMMEGRPALGGKFIDGLWQGHLYSNGCPESENPTPVSVVKDALAQAVEETLDRFRR